MFGCNSKQLYVHCTSTPTKGLVWDTAVTVVEYENSAKINAFKAHNMFLADTVDRLSVVNPSVDCSGGSS